MKYVILKLDAGQGVLKAFPIIFTQALNHVDVADDMKRRIRRDMRGFSEATVHSAGFMAFGANGPVCYRGSETLSIPREDCRCPEDERLILLNDSTSGIMF